MFPIYTPKKYNEAESSSKPETNTYRSLLNDMDFAHEIFDIFSPLVEKAPSCTKSRIDDNYNIVMVKDANGVEIANRIEVVIAPFAKDEVKVTVNPEDRRITVVCDKTDENYVFNGISHQTRSWSWNVPEHGVIEDIKAKIDDGILKITIPVTSPKCKDPGDYQINIE